MTNEQILELMLLALKGASEEEISTICEEVQVYNCDLADALDVLMFNRESLNEASLKELAQRCLEELPDDALKLLVEVQKAMGEETECTEKFRTLMPYVKKTEDYLTEIEQAR